MQDSSGSLSFHSEFKRNETSNTDNEHLEHNYLLTTQTTVIGVTHKDFLLSQLRQIGDINDSHYLSEVLENIKQEEIQKIKSYAFEDYKHSHKEGKTSIDVSFTSIRIDDIPNIEHNNVTFFYDVDSNKFQLGLQLLADMKVSGLYELDGKAGYFPIRGNGKAMVEIKKLSGKLSATANFDGNRLFMESLNIRFSLNSVEVNFENLINSNLSPFANVLLNTVAKPMVDSYICNNTEVMEGLMKRWKNSFDKKLAKETIKKFFSSLSNDN